LGFSDSLKGHGAKRYVVAKATIVPREVCRMSERDVGLGLAKDWNGPDMDADYEIGNLLLIEELVKDIFSEFLFTEPDAPDEARIMEFDHTLTEEECKTGIMPHGMKTNLRQPGTRFRHWISCIKFAKLFNEVLSDDSIPYDRSASPEEKSMDKIAYMLKYDEMFSIGHARFLKLWREEGKI